MFKIDWQKNEKLIKKAARDAVIKDLGSAMENVDLEKVKNVALDALTTTRDVMKSVDWEAVTRAGERIYNATNKIILIRNLEEGGPAVCVSYCREELKLLSLL